MNGNENQKPDALIQMVQRIADSERAMDYIGMTH